MRIQNPCMPFVSAPTLKHLISAWTGLPSCHEFPHVGSLALKNVLTVSTPYLTSLRHKTPPFLSNIIRTAVSTAPNFIHSQDNVNGPLNFARTNGQIAERPSGTKASPSSGVIAQWNILFFSTFFWSISHRSTQPPYLYFLPAMQHETIFTHPIKPLQNTRFHIAQRFCSHILMPNCLNKAISLMVMCLEHLAFQLKAYPLFLHPCRLYLLHCLPYQARDSFL